ncbi:MAG: hypothetical protein PHQ08_01725, partial [Candidatus Pacebacteria bacterium]|nr:hypothetical protein [Candidatus Paceibacterota bacterium]
MIEGKNIFNESFDRTKKENPKFVAIIVAVSIVVLLIIPALYFWFFRQEVPKDVISTTNLFTIPESHRPERDNNTGDFIIHFNNNRQRFAYRSSTWDERWFVVLNGKEQKEYDS